MSHRYEFTTVCAMDRIGDREYIYDRDYYVGGCEYKTTTWVGDLEHQVCTYPAEDLTEESGQKLPALTVNDLKSYFTDTPTGAMTEVLNLVKLAEQPFTQLVMTVQYGVDGTYCEAVSYNVTREGVEEIWYGGMDFVGDDAFSMTEHMVDEAWYSYHRKLGDLQEEEF